MNAVGVPAALINLAFLSQMLFRAVLRMSRAFKTVMSF